MTDGTTAAAAPDTTASLEGIRPTADVPRRLSARSSSTSAAASTAASTTPTTPPPTTQGFRADVLDLVRELGVTCVRYPRRQLRVELQLGGRHRPPREPPRPPRPGLALHRNQRDGHR